jgi:hypothetical protein
MRKLTVKNFSVIKEADLDLRGISVIVGPQASGKSLICKLGYFFLDIISLSLESISNQTSLAIFKQQVKAGFHSWFPVQSWGNGKLDITFTHGPFSASVLRTSYGKALGSNIRLTICQDFCAAYTSALDEVKALSARSKPGWEEVRPWRVREIARDRMAGFLGKDERYAQAYIPAGRAFFTTYGKAIAAFESGSLDRVTYRFGKLADSMFEHRYFTLPRNRPTAQLFEEIQYRVLKGRLQVKGERPTFEAEDGRILSLPNLSSGTQEALPLLASLRTSIDARPGIVTYVEEPEAHLFPSAQKEIVGIIALLANHHLKRSTWVITTHSPYILASFNNLVEAGRLAAAKPALREKIASFIPRRLWITEGGFKAYTIEDRILKSIVAEDTGLVSSNFLDQVSETIGAEFDELLRLGYVEP